MRKLLTAESSTNHYQIINDFSKSFIQKHCMGRIKYSNQNEYAFIINWRCFTIAEIFFSG